MYGDSILAMLLAVLGLVPQVAAQGFVSNCTWQTAIMADTWLGMYCNNDNWALFSYGWTWFDTNLCLINNGGQLIPYDSGNYWGSCQNCNVRGSHVDFTLNCSCYRPNGHMAPTTFDLNRIVYNHNGSLGCFDHIGNKTRNGPF